MAIIKHTPRLGLSLILGAILVSAQTDLTGYWVLRVPTGDGNYRETFFELKQSGESVTGRVLMGTREDLISEGTFKDGKLRFVINSGPPGQQRRVTYEGAVEGSRITLASQIPGREPIKGLAERSKPEAALPPPRLPLPQLHDVPDNGLARTPPMGWNRSQRGSRNTRLEFELRALLCRFFQRRQKHRDTQELCKEVIHPGLKAGLAIPIPGVYFHSVFTGSSSHADLPRGRRAVLARHSAIHPDQFVSNSF